MKIGGLLVFVLFTTIAKKTSNLINSRIDKLDSLCGFMGMEGVTKEADGMTILARA